MKINPITALTIAEAALRAFELAMRQVELLAQDGELTPEQWKHLKRRADASDARVDQLAEQARQRQAR
ncbi:hypothetical protein ACERK3_09505 [Phycisphaerales bacterium AB-hyl4]|uniref:Uncharacterized protein n=1 Tax=Natronomicrosphaera hydrolytica TaxID=3242702 RepID=A0ABV4U4K7_9BACT